MPVEDGHVEHGVMGDSQRITPRELVQPLACVFPCPGEPLGLTVIDLYGYADNLKELITDILFRSHLGETERLVVVGLEIAYYYAHL